MKRRRVLRVAGLVIGVLISLVLVAVATGYGLLRASLPERDGTVTVEGPSAPVTIERDARGRVTVRASTRDDLAFGLGYAHGQDRFFQMDLLRRAGAGTLAALVGRMGLSIDRGARTHDLATTARQAWERTEPRHRARIEAYARGVNAGLGSLGARPWEYFLLRQRPQPWRPVDTLHVVHAMMRDLQRPADTLELSRGPLRATLDGRIAAIVLDPFSPWDAPIAGGGVPRPVLQMPDAGPFRALDPALETTPDATGASGDATTDDAKDRGSNSFAVGGAYTADGRAVLGNDMHLRLGVPVIWYAARLVVDGRDPVDAVGVTLPGAPALIVGSNGSIAWGFTNSYGDWVDHVRLELDPDDPDRYRTPDGWKTITERVERIGIADGTVDTLIVRDTIWGPRTALVDSLPLVTRWVAQDPEALDLRLLDLMEIESVDAALDLAPTCGIPHQNFVVAGADGRIGWTIIGRVPRRVGIDGTVPTRWADGTRGWSGWLDPDEVPRHVFAPDGRVWTANGRVTTHGNQRIIGYGDFALGARAGVIRDALRALDRVDETTLLDVQMVTRSPLMQRWYERLRDVTGASPDPRHAAAARWFEDWTGGADASSVAYRLSRFWRSEVSAAVYDRGLMRPAREAYGNWVQGAHREPVVWSLLQSRPRWVPEPHATWDDLERAALDSVIAEWGDPETWAERTWGAYNTAVIEHPFASVLPEALARRLRMPRRALAGDSYTARVQWPSFGASERLVVAPGAEERGILHLPGGNAAHPLSEHRLGDYDDWAEGRPTPLLPGPPEHTLRLEPVR